MAVQVLPATPERWDDVVTAFGRGRGAGTRSCWCQRFIAGDPPDHRAALHHEIHEAAVPPGLIAYFDGEPAAWSRVGPRHRFPGVTGNSAIARVLDAAPRVPDTWWVTCIVVRRDHRGAGVGTALLEADVAFAREHGAPAVEGHPVDVDVLTAANVSASALFTGTLAMFQRAGFAELGRTYRSRPVMRRMS